MKLDIETETEVIQEEFEEEDFSSVDLNNDFAQLTGYVDTENEPTLNPSELSAFQKPEENRTTQTLINSPFSKMALVGGSGLFAFAIVGLFMNSVMSPTTPKPTAVAEKDPKNLVLSTALDPKEVELQKLKTDLALGNQVAAKPNSVLSTDLQKNNKQGLNPQTTATTALPTPIASPPPVSNLSVVPIDPVPVRQITVTPNPTPLILSPQNLPVVNPQEQWQTLANMGSYGSVSTDSSRSSSVIANNQVVIPNAQVVVPTNQVVVANNQVAPSNNQLSRNQPSYQARGANNTLLVGTTAKASIKTPVVFSPTGLVTGNGVPKFIVTLDDPLLTVDGKPAIPAGALLIVTVRPLDPKSGLAELDVVSISINGKEFSPPGNNAITIRGAEGAPLIGDNYFDPGNQIASLDLSTMLVTAAAEVGKLTNQAQSSSVSASVGNFSSTVVTPPPDYAGAAISGGFGYLSKILIGRNEDAKKEFANRSSIFVIGAGRQVQVFINQTTTF